MLAGFNQSKLFQIKQNHGLITEPALAGSALTIGIHGYAQRVLAAKVRVGVKHVAGNWPVITGYIQGQLAIRHGFTKLADLSIQDVVGFRNGCLQSARHEKSEGKQRDENSGLAYVALCGPDHDQSPE